MKIEKINENQIRCTLSRDDLAIRNIKPSDIAHITDKARKLFDEMMRAANDELGFNGENLHLMIEAHPMRPEGLVFVITRVDHQIDSPEALFDEYLDNVLGKDLPNNQENFKTFIFSNLDEMKAVARIIKPSYNGKSSLFLNEESGNYYLVLHEDPSNKNTPDNVTFNKIGNLISEYCAQIREGFSCENYYREHYKIIYDGNAIKKMSR